MPEFRVNPVLTTISATPDGRHVIFTGEARRDTQSDLWLMPLEANAKPVPLLRQAFDQRHGAISPDGRWLAYVSNESGANEVLVRPVVRDTGSGGLRAGAATLVSDGGGIAPRWRSDSRELFYQSANGRVMAAAVLNGEVQTPAALFDAPGMLPHWGVAPDGQRFLLALPIAQAAPAPFTVVVNWQAALERSPD